MAKRQSPRSEQSELFAPEPRLPGGFDYREALMEVIEEKVEAGGKEIEEKPKKAPKPTKVIDLVEVLQQSLKETRGAKKGSTAKCQAKHAQHEKKAA